LRIAPRVCIIVGAMPWPVVTRAHHEAVVSLLTTALEDARRDATQWQERAERALDALLAQSGRAPVMREPPPTWEGGASAVLAGMAQTEVPRDAG
jgi:hypothetical protein